MTDSLQLAVRAAQQNLRDRLELASAAMVAHAQTHEIRQKTDAFLVNTCRHTSAVCDVVLPAARSYLPKGGGRVREYVQQCRRLERAIGSTKQRMYGQAQASDRAWGDVWAHVAEEVRVLHRIEDELVTALARTPEPDRRPDLSLVIGSVTKNSPTRPHPNSPHTGPFAHLIRRAWAWADRFWDAAEGRIVSDRPVMAEPEDLAA